MGKHRFRKAEAPEIQGICCLCGVSPQKRKTNGKYQTLCRSCERRLYAKDYVKKERIRQFPYVVHKKDVCNTCGFTSKYSCQFDVDHIDGNHQNNSLGNLQTLCANCHRLKTYLNKDWIKNPPALDVLGGFYMTII